MQTADVGALRVWHQQAAHAGQPIVVLLEEVEEVPPAALEQLVLILRYPATHTGTRSPDAKNEPSNVILILVRSFLHAFWGAIFRP